MFYVMNYNEENDKVILLKTSQRATAIDVFNELKEKGYPVAYSNTSDTLRNYTPSVITHRVMKFKKLIGDEDSDNVK